MEETYYYKQHGLLWIVYEKVDTGLDVMSVEDSRWKSEKDAKLHCNLLNGINQRAKPEIKIFIYYE